MKIKRKKKRKKMKRVIKINKFYTLLFINYIEELIFWSIINNYIQILLKYMNNIVFSNFKIILIVY